MFDVRAGSGRRYSGLPAALALAVGAAASALGQAPRPLPSATATPSVVAPKPALGDPGKAKALAESGHGPPVTPNASNKGQPVHLGAIPQEVLFTKKGEKGSTTVKWNVGNYQVAGHVKVRVDDGPFVPWKEGKSGEAVYSGIEYGRTYTFRLDAEKFQDIMVPGAPLFVVTTGPPGCSKNCITSVTANPRATMGWLDAVTTLPAVFDMQVAADGAVDQEGNFYQPLWKKKTQQPLTQYTAQVTGLESPGTFHWVVKAADALGNVSTKKGSFQTLRRKILVVGEEFEAFQDGSHVKVSFTAGTIGKNGTFCDTPMAIIPSVKAMKRVSFHHECTSLGAGATAAAGLWAQSPDWTLAFQDHATLTLPRFPNWDEIGPKQVPFEVLAKTPDGEVLGRGHLEISLVK